MENTSESKQTSLESVKNNNNQKYQDFEFISCDPQENADNFDPKWAYFREMTTDEERYQAVRKRWGNADIPDPSVNLSHRQVMVLTEVTKSEQKENTECPPKPETKSGHQSRSAAPRMERGRKPRRSRSCTRPYEQLICNLEKNYYVEYCNLMFKHKVELQEMLQNQSQQFVLNSFCFPMCQPDNLKIQQEQEVINLLSNQYQQVQNFMGAKRENIEVCKRYMEEVRAFFTFYQKINDAEILLQMTDEQYEHTVETERMYTLYNKFYR